MHLISRCSTLFLLCAFVLVGCSDSSLTSPDAPDAPTDAPTTSVWVDLDISGPFTVAPGDYATWTMTDNGTATLSNRRWYVQPSYPLDYSYYCGSSASDLYSWMCTDFAPPADELALYAQGSDGSVFYIQAEAEVNGETVRSNAYQVAIESGGNGGGNGGGDDDGSCEPMTPCPN